MAIISQKTWDNISGVAQEEIKMCYSELKDNIELNNREILQLEWLFGKENLQPKPKTPKWADVEESENEHEG